MPIPVQRLRYATVVVRDLEAAARNYATILGIERWDVAHLTPDRMTQASAYGAAAQFGYSAATGANLQGVTFRLVQPGEGFSSFTEFLASRGQGVHGLCPAIVDEPAFRLLKDELCARGAPVIQSATIDGAMSHYWFDTRELLGGYFVEIAIAREGSVRVDEQWDFSGQIERPDGAAPALEIPKILHFGVATTNMMRHVQGHAQVFGIDRWDGLHFRTAPDSLEFSLLNGAPVKHAWLLASGQCGDFGFEVLQGTEGPTHYKEEFIDRLGGAGIHHLLLLRGLPEARWLPLRAWLESMDIVNVMSGRVAGGAAEFFYMDARARLGLLMEVIVSHAAAATPPPPPRPGRFSFDFSQAAQL